MNASDYKKKDLHNHILDRPETYIGGTKKINEDLFVYEENCIIKKNVNYCPAFIKIFDEILVNAIDHSVRDTTVTYIKVDIEKETGIISIENNGNGIPIEVHPEYDIYVPELVFGNLLTSSNYDDTKERIVGGMNGLGGTCANIFSEHFTVETCNSKYKYKQTFKDNMKNKHDPIITKNKAKPYTKITFLPDYRRLDMDSLDSESYSLLLKRVYDTTVCTDKRIFVYLNGVKLNQRLIKDYIKLYTETKTEFYSITQGQIVWDLGVSLSTCGFQQVSFVNGVSTNQGGKHVDYITNQLLKKLSEQICTKKKLKEVKTQYIKDTLSIFLRSTIINPKFGSQSKEKLITPQKDFGISFELPEDFISKVYKLGVGDEVASLTSFKNKKDLDKNVSKKTKIKIAKLEDAHNAGTSKSKQCSLILTEGDSAKTFAVSGFSIIGRQNYGIYPLRGKCLNIREATQKQLIENEEINNIKKIMGLHNSKKYDTEEEFDSLRYNSIIILADSDFDGFHIAGLIINFIHYWWPALLKRKGFIKTIKTPIVKVTKGSETVSFYNEKEYIDWVKTKKGNWSAKYYKGLGTSTAKEAKEIFKDLSKNIRFYIPDVHTDSSIELAFDKKKANERKIWLKSITDDYAKENKDLEITFDDFINKELIHFSNYDNIRSIPSMIDGLKPSQRKVLFTSLKKNQIKEVKVAQFGASVAELTQYHHGEASIFSTIIGMAQNYVGSNNINLLEPCGQFGTRSSLGKDAASPRYIFTRLSDKAIQIFHKDDNPILDYLKEDNQQIEPRFYTPTIPMVLINSVVGIGTGYSTNIPSFNPEDVIENMKKILDKEEPKDLIPWYRGFKGTITKDPENEMSFLCKGLLSSNTKKTLKITEIPIGVSIENYKNMLETFEEFETINNSTEEEPNFELSFKTHEELVKFDYNKLKLTSKINMTNMHLFDENNKIKKYNNPNDIIRDFLKVKLKFLGKRKEYLKVSLESEITVSKNKKRFLEEIMADTITIYKKKKDDVSKILSERDYLLVDAKYDYLISMPISSFNLEKLNSLTKNIIELEKQLDEVNKTSEKQFLLNDLDLI